MCHNPKSIIIIFPNNFNIQNVFFKYNSYIKFSFFVLSVKILGKNKLFLRYLLSKSLKFKWYIIYCMSNNEKKD